MRSSCFLWKTRFSSPVLPERITEDNSGAVSAAALPGAQIRFNSRKETDQIVEIDLGLS